MHNPSILKPYKLNQKCFIGHSFHSSIFGHPNFYPGYASDMNQTVADAFRADIFRMDRSRLIVRDYFTLYTNGLLWPFW